jgi:hypothetical protein
VSHSLKFDAHGVRDPQILGEDSERALPRATSRRGRRPRLRSNGVSRGGAAIVRGMREHDVITSAIGTSLKMAPLPIGSRGDLDKTVEVCEPSSK